MCRANAKLRRGQPRNRRTLILRTFAGNSPFGERVFQSQRSPHVKPIPPRSKRPVSSDRPAPAGSAGEWAWHYRTLLALRDHLKGCVGDRLRESSGAMEPPSLHAEDLLDELYDRDLVSALPANTAQALQEIEHALQRIKNKEYGRCEATRRRIPKTQLRQMPWRRFAQGVPTLPVPRPSIRRRAASVRKQT